jgi:hypothetical protein
MTHIALTPFGAQQLRALRISQSGAEVLRKGGILYAISRGRVYDEETKIALLKQSALRQSHVDDWRQETVKERCDSPQACLRALGFRPAHRPNLRFIESFTCSE